MNPLLQGTEQAALPGRLNPSYLEGRPLPLAEPVARALGLRDGQVVQAAIRLDGESLKLQLSDQLLDLPPGLRFRPGDEIWLRAYRGIGGWVLKPTGSGPGLPPAPLAATADAETPSAISRLLALSLRPPAAPSLLDLFRPASAAALVRAAGDPELAAQVGRLQLSMRGLSPAALQGAVLSSGLWAEAMLGRGQAPPPTDAKSLLRRMVRALSERDSGAIEQLKRAIDDIESSQVDALAAQARGELSFSMVLPFSDANPVHIRFFRPARRADREAPPFSVDIHTVNEVLGEIWLKTSVARAAHVDLLMWALKDSVVRHAQRHSAALGKRLAESGLTLDSFRIFHAARPNLPDSWTPPGAMLDVSA